MIKNCPFCKLNYKAKWKNRKYCSVKCKNSDPVFRKKLSVANTGKRNPIYVRWGEKNPLWKGDKVGYWGIHRWLVKKFGTATQCEGSQCKGISVNFEWALLKEKKYERKRENFWMLCKSCHSIYDQKGYKK